MSPEDMYAPPPLHTVANVPRRCGSTTGVSCVNHLLQWQDTFARTTLEFAREGLGHLRRPPLLMPARWSCCRQTGTILQEVLRI